MVTVTEEERDAYFKHSYKVAFWNGAKVGLISLAAVGLFTYLAKPRSWGPDLVWRYRMISTTFAFTAGFGFGFERSIVNLSKYPPWVVADFNSKFAREQQMQESNKNQ